MKSILGQYFLGMETRDPMLDINMQASLHGMLIAVGALDEDSKVAGKDLPGLANDWLATYHPHLIYKDED
jgi:hypothetical protein